MLRLCLASGGLLVINSSEPVRFTANGDWERTPLRFILRQLEYFVAVGEAGSIAKAAEQVNVSPPSISASIVQLEAEFGIQLFVRKHSQGLSLTPGGRFFFNEVSKLLDWPRPFARSRGRGSACHWLSDDLLAIGDAVIEGEI